MTLYSQRNPLWAKKKLGFSNLTIGEFGCTITALAMLLNTYGYAETPETVNENLKKVNGFQGALVIWSAVEKVYPRVSFIKRVRNYNNIEVAFQVYIKKNPVLVEVNGSKIDGFRHWVVFIGDRKCLDPWYGKILSTSFYTPQTGYSIYERV